MATYKILEKANEYRIQIVGTFAGSSVRDVETRWKAALQANLQRQLVVDISRLDGYDSHGQMLLREMHKHGTLIAASTSLSLVYLQEVTSVNRGAVPQTPGLTTAAPSLKTASGLTTAAPSFNTGTADLKKPQARHGSRMSVAAANN